MLPVVLPDEIVDFVLDDRGDERPRADDPRVAHFPAIPTTGDMVRIIEQEKLTISLFTQDQPRIWSV
jgi:hypothetical protein